MNYDLSQLLTPQVDREMARQLCEKLGQRFDDERVERIAKDAREIINEGFPAPFAFSEAYFNELDIYGDPQASQIEIVGILP